MGILSIYAPQLARSQLLSMIAGGTRNFCYNLWVEVEPWIFVWKKGRVKLLYCYAIQKKKKKKLNSTLYIYIIVIDIAYLAKNWKIKIL